MFSIYTHSALLVAAVTAVGALHPTPTHAAIISNGDFEQAEGDPPQPADWRTNDAPNSTFEYRDINSIGGAGDDYIYIQTNDPGPGADGARWISDSATVDSATLYEIQFDYATRSNFASVRIDFYTDGTFVSGVEDSTPQTSTENDRTWVDHAFEFSTPAGVNQIQAVFIQRANFGRLSVDNVEVNVVPEPGSMLLAVGGLSLLLPFSRRGRDR
jgi:hypothetical protein